MKILYNTGSKFKESKESTYKMMVKVVEDNGNIVEKSVQELVSNSFYDIKRLIGTEDSADANRSVRAIARNELAKQLIPENASEALNTLQEIADWIQENPESASQMNSRIDALEEAVPFVLYIQNGVYGYKNANNEFVAFKSQADIDAAVAASAAVGTATAADVLVGKTFSNSTDKGINGTMVNLSESSPYQHASNNDTPHIAGDALFLSTRYNRNTNANDQTVIGIRYNGDSGYLRANTLLSYPASGFGDASASHVLSGKKFTSQNGINATGSMPSRSLGTAATGSGIDGTGPYVYIPYGYWPEYSGKAGSSYAYMTAAQAVAACPKEERTVTAGTSAASITPNTGKLISKVTYNPTPSQEKSTTASRSAQTITPDSGKLLSKVSIAKYPDASGTFTTSTNSSAVDMGATNNYRYVNTTGVYDAGKIAGISNPIIKVTDSVYASGSSSKSMVLDNNSYYIIFGAAARQGGNATGIVNIKITSGATVVKNLTASSSVGGCMTFIKTTAKTVNYKVDHIGLNAGSTVYFNIYAIKLF